MRLACGLLVVLFGSAALADDAGTPYSNEALGFQLVLPSGWTTSKNPPDKTGDTITVDFDGPHTDMGETCSVTMLDKPQTAGVGQADLNTMVASGGILTEELKELRQQYPDANVLEQSIVSRNGMTLQTSRMTASVAMPDGGKLTLVLRDNAMFVPGHAYTVDCGSAEAGYDAAKADMESLMASFVLTAKK